MKKFLFIPFAIGALCVQKASAQEWSLTGNANATTSSKLGTTNNIPVRLYTNNTARIHINSSNGNTGIGTTSPVQKLDVAGNINLAKGFGLYAENRPVLRVDSVKGSVFLGNSAGAKSVGSFNTATGYHALSLNTVGANNTANGTYALFSNAEGSSNLACGTNTLFFNTAGSYNTAVGFSALVYNKNGNGNVATGANSLFYNSTGYYNAAVGVNALYSNVSGNDNTAMGTHALGKNHYVSNNTALGSHAGDFYFNGWNNTFVGAYASADRGDLYNCIAFGYDARVYAPNQVRIGNYYNSSIGGYAGWTNVSDGRVKKNVRENVPGLAFINKLNPITYNLDLDAADKITGVAAAKDQDGKPLTRTFTQTEIAARQAKQKIVYTGFKAQDVEKAAKELGFDFSGVDAAKNEKDLYGLRYSEFVVPLVRAVQELLIAS